MNKDFFASIDQRTAAFTEREGTEAAEVELLLGTGRTVRLERVVELNDAWFHADVVDMADPDRIVSLACPYWQIQQVSFVRPRKRLRHAGFVSDGLN